MFVHLSVHQISLPHMIWCFYVSKVIRFVSNHVALFFRVTTELYYSVIELPQTFIRVLQRHITELPQSYITELPYRVHHRLLLYKYRIILQSCHRVIVQCQAVVLQNCHRLFIIELYSYIIVLPQLYCSVILQSYRIIL